MLVALLAPVLGMLHMTKSSLFADITLEDRDGERLFCA
jgi:hypothetical protein